jgi:protease PrsW
MDDFYGILLSIFFGFGPMFFFAWIIYWIDRYEKEPKILLLGVFTWGAIVAAGSAFIINTILGIGVYIATESELAAELATGSLFAPIIEESLKGLAVLLIFFLFWREFDSILDGIVYAAIAALGFAATENAYYIFSFGYLEEGFSGLFQLVFVRVVLVGWQHPFYTAFIGIGLAISRLNRGWLISLAAPVIGWAIAVFTHSVHNTLLSFVSGLGGFAFTILLDWSGWFIMFLFILWAINKEQRNIIKFMHEEVALGVIQPSQYKTACSAWAQSFARFASLFSGNYRATSRFYQLIGELAHKKYQRSRLGEEGGNTAIIDGLRTELVRLAPSARA